MSSLPNVLHIAEPSNDGSVRVRASKVALEVVVSARAVHDEHLGKEARSSRNREVYWGCGKEGRTRMAVIAVFAARGWSMVWFLGLAIDSVSASGIRDSEGNFVTKYEACETQFGI